MEAKRDRLGCMRCVGAGGHEQHVPVARLPEQLGQDPPAPDAQERVQERHALRGLAVAVRGVVILSRLFGVGGGELDGGVDIVDFT